MCRRDRAKEGRDADFYRGVWKRLLPETRGYLVAKAEVTEEDFRIIAFEIRKRGAKAPVGERGADGDLSDDGRRNGTIVLVRYEDGWRQTNRYANHPIKQLWWSGGEAIKYLGKYESGKGMSDD